MQFLDLIGLFYLFFPIFDLIYFPPVSSTSFFHLCGTIEIFSCLFYISPEIVRCSTRVINHRSSPHLPNIIMANAQPSPPPPASISEQGKQYLFELAQKSFRQADEDNDGRIDMSELILALCRLHKTLDKGACGATKFPTKASVIETLKKADLDSDGKLSEEEFLIFAVTWFQENGVDFVKRIAFFAAVYAVLIPGSAKLIQDRVPGGRKIPNKLIAALLTIGFKIIVARKEWSL